jgi:7,8-dihydropterin-6-yl-methyl-4-(beta-D-ribofuranosyl)aminobenzene 5'-phosphate synthase
LNALLGGLHLTGSYFAPSIGPTAEALIELAPDLVVPGHCSGWRAQHTLAAALPDIWEAAVGLSSGSALREAMPTSSGRSHTLMAFPSPRA